MKLKFNNLVTLFRRHYIFSLSLILMVFVFAMPVRADVIGGLMQVLSGIFGLLAMIVGYLLAFLLQILVNVAQFNNFIYAEPVVYGWVVVRDICNMFFIVVLLIIAFATILQLNGYDYKKDVPKLVIAAILINFSKMFAGLMIDVSQVIMLTFVNAFSANGANNFAMAFQIGKFTSLGGDTLSQKIKNGGNFPFALLLASIAAFAAACIATVITVVMIMALVMRIVMLWIYVILSPLPYLLNTFSQGKSYAGKWWGEFSKELIGGPVLAFFLWLALTVAKMPDGDLATGVSTGDGNMARAGEAWKTFTNGGTDLFTNGPFQKYLIVIGLMVGGLKIAGEASGTMGAWAKKGSAWVNSGANLSKKMALSPIKGAQLGVKTLGSYGIDTLHSKTGVDLNVARVWKGIKEKREEKRGLKYNAGQEKAYAAMTEGGRLHGILAMSGLPKTAWDQITSAKGRYQRFTGGINMKEKREAAQRSLNDAQNARGDEVENLKSQRGKYISREDKINLNSQLSELKAKQEELRYKRSSSQSLTPEQMQAEREEADQVKLNIKELESKLFNREVLANGKVVVSPKIVDNNQAKILDDEIKKKESETSDLEKGFQTIINRNIPSNSTEARKAGEKAESVNMDKISGMTDSSELLRVLTEAIAAGNKPMIKAVTKKMAKVGDDNEFLLPLAGRTDAVGLQKFMRSLIGGKVGFSEQEAFTLGSDIGMINKGTNHWAAHAAYEMKDGHWVETSEEDQAMIRHSEVGKMHAQKQVRDINRLGYGYHDKADGKFHLDMGGVLLLKLLDNDEGRNEILKNMNESTAKNILDDLAKLNSLVGKGVLNQKIVDTLQKRAATAVKGSGYNDEIAKIKSAGVTPTR